MRKLALLALCFLTVTVHAQVPRPSAAAPDYLTAPVELKDGWRLHTGDNSLFAQPGLNIAEWQPVTVGPETTTPMGWSWYRLTLELPGNHPPLALLLNAPKGTCEAYADGERLSGMEIASWLAVTDTQPAVVALPQTAGPITIALRFHRPGVLVDAWNPHISVWLGTAPAIRAQADGARQSSLLRFLPSLSLNLAMFLASLGMIGLFLAQRSSTEYLWLGMFLLMGSCEAIFHGAQEGLIPVSINNFFSDPAVYIEAIAQIEFTYAFIRRKPGRAWRCYEVILLIGIAGPYLLGWLGFSSSTYMMMEGSVLLPVAMGLPLILLLWFHRGNREAGWLIFPSLLPAVAIAMGDIGFVASRLGFISGASLGDTISVGPFSLYSVDLADAAFLLAIAIVIMLRFVRVSREKARAAAELEAAQKVQSLLVHSSQDAAPDWRIRAVYRPAAEVGGDFYHVQPLEGRGALVAVGDVSGKGVEAALRVAAAIGVLRETGATAPSVVLRRLNTTLKALSQGGFVTCIAARIEPDGSVMIANAGHLAPYLGGKELAVDNGLPLGIAGDVQYAEATFRLSPGDTLTFLSDGVVEARNSAGDLFGFDRTREISNQSAEQIADAARAFGQEDDITVVTLAFAPAEVLHA